LAGQSLKLRI